MEKRTNEEEYTQGKGNPSTRLLKYRSMIGTYHITELKRILKQITEREQHSITPPKLCHICTHSLINTLGGRLVNITTIA